MQDNSSVGDGTLFLQEYMIPRGSSSFCLYDTRSLSDDSSENIEMLKHWMTRGVCNGKLVVRSKCCVHKAFTYGGGILYMLLLTLLL